jgi:hypothetical protein
MNNVPFQLQEKWTNTTEPIVSNVKSITASKDWGQLNYWYLCTVTVKPKLQLKQVELKILCYVQVKLEWGLHLLTFGGL